MWDWKEHTLLQDIDLGDNGMVPLELHFLHNPDATEGYVAATLSSNMIRFYKDKVCTHSSITIVYITAEKFGGERFRELDNRQ